MGWQFIVSAFHSGWKLTILFCDFCHFQLTRFPSNFESWQMRSLPTLDVHFLSTYFYLIYDGISTSAGTFFVDFQPLWYFRKKVACFVLSKRQFCLVGCKKLRWSFIRSVIIAQNYSCCPEVQEEMKNNERAVDYLHQLVQQEMIPIENFFLLLHECQNQWLQQHQLCDYRCLRFCSGEEWWEGNCGSFFNGTLKHHHKQGWLEKFHLKV